MVLEVLKSSDFFYGDILLAICKHWDNVSLNGVSSNNDSLYRTTSLGMHMKEQKQIPVSNPPVPMASLTCAVKNETDAERKIEEDSDVGNFGVRSDISKSVSLMGSETAKESMHLSSKVSVDATETKMGSGIGYDSNKTTKFLDQSDIPGNHLRARDCSLKSAFDMRRESNVESTGPENLLTTKIGEISQVQCGIGYMNYYSFGRVASSIAEELLDKSSEKMKENSLVSEDEIILQQTRAILRRSSKFYWSSIRDLNIDAEKEKCGWCFSCKVASDDRDCLFLMNVGSVRASTNSDMDGLHLEKNSKGHLADVICHILSIENRLLGLLLGPWLNPQHSKLWRKNILMASDLLSVKHLLLTVSSSFTFLLLFLVKVVYHDAI